VSNNLKKDVPFPQDRPSVIGTVRRRNAVEIDLTKGFAARRQDIKELLEKFDVADARPMLDGILQEITTEREKQEKLRQEQQVHNKEIYDAQHQPIDNFTRAYLSKDPSALAEYFRQEKAETLSSILNELTGQERRFDSIFHGNVYHAIQVLRFQIAMKAHEQKPSLVTKIKEKLGA
jgi:hypothetical protein